DLQLLPRVGPIQVVAQQFVLVGHQIDGVSHGGGSIQKESHDPEGEIPLSTRTLAPIVSDLQSYLTGGRHPTDSSPAPRDWCLLRYPTLRIDRLHDRRTRCVGRQSARLVG